MLSSSSDPLRALLVAPQYLSFPPSAGEPPKVLRGFEKVVLQPGQEQTVSMHLSSKDLSTWQAGGGWTQATGTFTAMVGSSSRDIRANATLTL